MKQKNSDMIKRLDRLEECLEVIVGFFYRHKNYMQQSDEDIEFATGLAENMYEDRTGLDIITGEKLD